MLRQRISTNKSRPLNLFNVTALGIGAMIGAGIFALLGQAALLVHSATWISFAVGGVIALFSGYAYSCLSANYPDRGGIIDFFKQGLSSPTLANTLSFLYLFTLVLTVAMVARAFGAYALQLFHSDTSSLWILRGYTAGIILVLAFLNVMSSDAVGRTEVVFVVIKLSILTMLIVAGSMTIEPDLLSIKQLPSAENLFSSVGITFFAYAGFGMMANASDKVADPRRTMPRAFMLAIGVTIIFYIALSLVLLGNISPQVLVKHADTAVAQVAYPILGPIGFTIVSVGALLATASAINATLFSAFNIIDSMNVNRILPSVLRNKIWRLATYGNVGTVAIVLLLSLTLNLSSLANVASATFLICYLVVFMVAWRLRVKIKASRLALLTGFILMLLVFIGFIYSLLLQGTSEVLIVLIALAASWLFARLHSASESKEQA